MKSNHYIGKSAYRGDVAINYDRDRVVEPVWEEEQSWVRDWSKCIPLGATLLDLPAGTGRFLEIWKSRGARVNAVDISEDMLNALKKRNSADGENLIIECADAESLPHKSDSFDFVICWRLVHLLPPIPAERVLCELARVCRGQIILQVFNVYRGGLIARKLRAIRQRVGKLLRSTPSNRRIDDSSTPWSHIPSHPQTESNIFELISRCGLRLKSAQTIGVYQGTLTRVYILERRLDV